MRRRRVALGCAMVLQLGVAVAAAHPVLLDSTPKADTAVVAPRRLVLRFNGRVEPRLSPVTLVGGPRHARLVLRPERSEQPEILTYSLPLLEPGSYRVEWKVLSVDGHLTNGVLRFAVVPQSPTR